MAINLEIREAEASARAIEAACERLGWQIDCYLERAGQLDTVDADRLLAAIVAGYGPADLHAIQPGSLRLLAEKCPMRADVCRDCKDASHCGDCSCCKTSRY